MAKRRNPTRLKRIWTNVKAHRRHAKVLRKKKKKAGKKKQGVPVVAPKTKKKKKKAQ